MHEKILMPFMALTAVATGTAFKILSSHHRGAGSVSMYMAAAMNNWPYLPEQSVPVQ